MDFRNPKRYILLISRGFGDCHRIKNPFRIVLNLLTEKNGVKVSIYLLLVLSQILEDNIECRETDEGLVGPVSVKISLRSIDTTSELVIQGPDTMRIVV